MTERQKRITFVTGRLAAPALRPLVVQLAEEVGFEANVSVAKISVAALMSAEWLIGKLTVPAATDRVVLPGLCSGDISRLSEALGGVLVELGPKDLRELPEFFHRPRSSPEGYGAYDIEILAEINHANRLSLATILRLAEQYRCDGADVIDLGCTPSERWTEIAAVTSELAAGGFRVSIDSFDPREVADAAGAELVLSVNSSNRHGAKDWGREVVVIPDRPDQSNWLESMQRTVDVLEADGVRYRLDPVLDPIGFGFARSLGRYLRTRDHFPGTSMMMGIGNLTELTEVDSAGVNTLLIAFCQELGISSVLTTEVINWARSSVREIAVARALMKFAVDQHVLPKHLDGRLLCLRDARIIEHGEEELHRLQREITDPNFRLFAENGNIIALNNELLEQSDDAFELFDRLGVTDPSHAFYLGWEMMKAATALQLGKRYVQDQSLRWGLYSREEVSHRRKKENRPPS